jgi:hypothetical protein
MTGHTLVCVVSTQSVGANPWLHTLPLLHISHGDRLISLHLGSPSYEVAPRAALPSELIERM